MRVLQPELKKPRLAGFDDHFAKPLDCSKLEQLLATVSRNTSPGRVLS